MKPYSKRNKLKLNIPDYHPQKGYINWWEANIEIAAVKGKERQTAKKIIQEEIMKKELKSIPINIWDDYYDDGYVPEGEIQKTYAYVEEYDILEDVEKAEIIDILKEYIDTIELENVKYYAGFYLNFEGLTHKLREELVEKLIIANLNWKGVPFEIYSES
jgi:hypothetical protein